jgi:hypothetical protein
MEFRLHAGDLSKHRSRVPPRKFGIRGRVWDALRHTWTNRHPLGVADDWICRAWLEAAMQDNQRQRATQIKAFLLELILIMETKRSRLLNEVVNLVVTTELSERQL